MLSNVNFASVINDLSGIASFFSKNAKNCTFWQKLTVMLRLVNECNRPCIIQIEVYPFQQNPSFLLYHVQSFYVRKKERRNEQPVPEILGLNLIYSLTSHFSPSHFSVKFFLDIPRSFRGCLIHSLTLFRWVI